MTDTEKLQALQRAVMFSLGELRAAMKRADKARVGKNAVDAFCYEDGMYIAYLRASELMERMIKNYNIPEAP